MLFLSFLVGPHDKSRIFFLPFIFFGHKKIAMLLSIYTSFSLLIMAINSILLKKKKEAHVFWAHSVFFSFFFNLCPLNFSRCYGLIDWFIYFNSTYIGYRIGNLPQVKNRFFINEKLKKKKEKKMKKNDKTASIALKIDQLLVVLISFCLIALQKLSFETNILNTKNTKLIRFFEGAHLVQHL